MNIVRREANQAGFGPPMICTARIMPSGQVRVQHGLNQQSASDREMWLVRSGLRQVMLGEDLKMWVHPNRIRHSEWAHVNPAATALADRVGRRVPIYGPVLISAGPLGEPPLGLSDAQVTQVRGEVRQIMRAVRAAQARSPHAAPGLLLDVAVHAAQSSPELLGP